MFLNIYDPDESLAKNEMGVKEIQQSTILIYVINSFNMKNGEISNIKFSVSDSYTWAYF